MLLFGHTGITLGAAILLNGVLNKRHSADRPASPTLRSESETAQTQTNRSSRSWLVFPKDFMDMRLLVIGSLLPDIIDKPVGQVIFSDAIQNGRIVCHTLLFFLILFLAGLYLFRNRKRSWLLVLSLGTLSHLIMDGMWLMPQTLLWPAYGWTFPREPENWASIIRNLLTNPAVYIPELVGLAVLVWFAWALLRNRRAQFFLRNGRI